jgi:RND family efflux transporter MFP subunit
MVKEELVLSGELKATENANIAFTQSGTVAWVGVKVGDSVKKGQALMQLDTTSTNAAYQQARSALLAAEANVNYIHDNLKDKASTETFAEKNTRVAAEVAHDNAYNAMLAAQKSLRDGTIRAPFAGIVAQITNESAGVNISATVPQINVVNPATLYFSVNADQTDVSHIHIGDKATLALDAFLNETISGVVSDISFTPSTADSGTVYPIRLTLTVDNSAYKYKVGMTGDTTFVLSQKENVLSVPAKYIKSDKQGKYVYIDSKNTKKYITVGIEGEDRTEIQGDITEGTVVYD